VEQKYVSIILEKKNVYCVMEVQSALINFEKAVVLIVGVQKFVAMVTINIYALNVEEIIYANIVKYEINVSNVMVDLYVNMENENQPVKNVMEVIYARMKNKRVNVLRVHRPVDVSIVTPFPLLAPNGIHTVFDATVFLTQM
jgi:hypothetical protein